MKKNYKFLLLILVISLIYKQNILAQEVLLFEKTPLKFEEFDGDFGPNRKKFNFSSLGFGAPISYSFNSEKSFTLSQGK